MKITTLKAQVKSPDRVSVFVDGKYSFSVTVDDVLSCGLKKGLELTEADIVRFKKLSSDNKVKAHTYEWLLSRPRSTRELKDYFYRKKIEQELQQRLIDEFTAARVLDDKRFAEWAADRSARKNKSFRVASNELRSKGIDVATIAETVAIDDMTALVAIINKVSGRPRYSDQKKLIAYLLSKGFLYNDIRRVLSLQAPEQGL